MLLTRKYRFSASHRLHSSCLSEYQNEAVYGKCNNPYGHGHNYVLQVTAAGKVGREGRLLPPGELDRYVHQHVLSALDHRDLNQEVADFEDLVPTTENLAIVIARKLRQNWTGVFGDVHLHTLYIEETGRNSFELNDHEIQQS